MMGQYGPGNYSMYNGNRLQSSNGHVGPTVYIKHVYSIMSMVEDTEAEK